MRQDDTSAKRFVVQYTGNAHAWNFMRMRTVFTACTTHRRCFSSPTRLSLLTLRCVLRTRCILPSCVCHEPGPPSGVRPLWTLLGPPLWGPPGNCPCSGHCGSVRAALVRPLLTV